MSAMRQHPSASGLKGIPVFAGLSDAGAARHGLVPASRALRAGEDLFVEGDPPSKAWFVRAGWVRIRVHSPGGHEATIVLLGPGEFCGAVEEEGAAQPYAVTALTDAETVGVPAAAFRAWLREDARAAARLAEMLGRRLLETARLKAINAERADVRVALTLGWLARKVGPRIPATRALLADLTGLRAETCSRVLSALRRKGALRVSPGVIEVLQPERLEPPPERR